MDPASKWARLETSINVLIDNLDDTNVLDILYELFKNNLFKAKGLVVRKLIICQQQYYEYTRVYSSLVNVLNSKIPEIGEILANKLVIIFKNEFYHNKFINIDFLCELVNYQVINEMLILQIIDLLMTHITNDSITIVIRILKLNGAILAKNVSYSVIDKLRNLMNEGQINDANKTAFNQLLHIRRKGFVNFSQVLEPNDEPHWVDLNDNFRSFNELMIDDGKEYLDYEQLKQEIFDQLQENQSLLTETDVIQEEDVLDVSQSQLIELQKTVYLTIMSSLSSEEAVHKLLKLKYDIPILTNIIIRSCIQEKTYSKFYGLISEILIIKFPKYKQEFILQFENNYTNIHQVELNGIRNLGKLYGYLISTHKLNISILHIIRLTEDHTNSSSRIFLKFLFKEMVEELGLDKFKTLMNSNMADLPDLFPLGGHKDDLIFAINYFTAIGLGIVTDDMRDDLKNARGRTKNRILEDGHDSSRSSIYSRSRSSSYSRSGGSGSNDESRSASYSRSPSRSPSNS